MSDQTQSGKAAIVPASAEEQEKSQIELELTPALKLVIEKAALRVAQSMICDFSEVELLAYRAMLRKNLGYRDDGGKLQ